MNAGLQQLIAALPHDESADDDAAALALVSQRAIPTGRLARLWTLGTMQAQIAAAYAALWVRSFFGGSDGHAQQLVETHMAAAMLSAEELRDESRVSTRDVERSL